MSEGGIGRATHEPLFDQYFTLDSSRDRVVIPTRHSNRKVPTSILYKKDIEIGDPDVFIELSPIENGCTPEEPYFVLGDNVLFAWRNKNRSELYDYRIDLGFSTSKETLDLLNGILTFAPPSQRDEVKTNILDPYTCRVTADEGVTIFDAPAVSDVNEDEGKEEEARDSDSEGNILFSLFPGGYSINTFYAPNINEGWSGDPPQRMTASELGSVYEIVSAAIEIPAKLAFDHRIKHGTVIPHMITMTRGIEFHQRDFSLMSQDIQALVNAGMQDDYALRKLVNPFIRFETGIQLY